MEKRLNAKELLFCKYSAAHYSPREAAAKAGYLFPEKTGMKLLSREKIRDAIKEIENLKPDCGEVADGLRRIAFGSIADVVKLMTAEDVTSLNFDEMDLYMISELKFAKSGGIEVKLHDRIKALEKLGELSDASSDGDPSAFLEAIEMGAAALKEVGTNEV